MGVKVSRQKKLPLQKSFIALQSEYLPGEVPSIQFRELWISDSKESLPPSFASKRQKVRLHFLSHLAEFRAHLSIICETFHNIGEFVKHCKNFDKLVEEFENSWKVRLIFKNTARMTLDQVYERTISRKQNKTERIEEIVPWIYDLKNHLPQIIDPLNIVNELDEVKDEVKFANEFFYLKVPFSMNKEELEAFVNRLNFLSEPKGYIRTDIDTALDVFFFRREVGLTFLQIAKELNPEKEGEALQSQAATYRKLYRKIMSDIIDPPKDIDRK